MLSTRIEGDLVTIENSDGQRTRVTKAEGERLVDLLTASCIGVVNPSYKNNEKGD